MLEQKTDDLCTDVVELKTDNKTEHTEIKVLIKDFIETADKKYASKRVEQVFYSTLGAVALYIIYFVLKQVGIG